MAQLNRNPVISLATHEGAPARRIDAEAQLRRSVMACLLWEDTFYEEGASIADRIAHTVKVLPVEKVSAIAIECRSAMNIRHASLLLAREMARNFHGRIVADTIAGVIQRADELAEFLAIYWKDGRCPLSAQVKKGLAQAFGKFGEYQLAKYNRDNAVKLRDVLFLCHAKPKDAEQEALWKRLIDGTLATPDTWEVELSAGKDKKETFERLMAEKKLGALAALRNLRNMEQAGCSRELIAGYLAEMDVRRVLPFRFVAAARAVPAYEPMLEVSMLRSCKELPSLSGRTAILVDVSGSMNAALSEKSDMLRMDAAAALAMILREICQDIRVYAFSDRLAEIPARHGFGLIEAIEHSMPHGSTYLGAAIAALAEYDRLIVVTDEQAHDVIPNPKGQGYLINVAPYQNGVGYGPWTHIDGWSESIVRYIAEMERRDVSN